MKLLMCDLCGSQKPLEWSEEVKWTEVQGPSFLNDSGRKMRHLCPDCWGEIEDNMLKTQGGIIQSSVKDTVNTSSSVDSDIPF